MVFSELNTNVYTARDPNWYASPQPPRFYKTFYAIRFILVIIVTIFQVIGCTCEVAHGISWLGGQLPLQLSTTLHYVTITDNSLNYYTRPLATSYVCWRVTGYMEGAYILGITASVLSGLTVLETGALLFGIPVPSHLGILLSVFHLCCAIPSFTFAAAVYFGVHCPEYPGCPLDEHTLYAQGYTVGPGSVIPEIGIVLSLIAVGISVWLVVRPPRVRQRHVMGPDGALVYDDKAALVPEVPQPPQ